MAVLVAHWIAGLSGEIVALTLVVPKLNGPHKSLYGSRISVPIKRVEKKKMKKRRRLWFKDILSKDSLPK